MYRARYFIWFHIHTLEYFYFLPLMTFHTESVETSKLTRQIRTEKRVLIHINKRPVQPPLIDPTINT